MRLKSLKAESGVTLIELVISIVVISISLVGILTVVNLTNKHSADPVLLNQSLAIAQSYMDEILLQNYPGAGSGVTCYSGSVRANFNCVDNYNGLNNVGVQNQQGIAVSGLSQYTVNVTVSAPTTLADGVAAKQITVNVTGPGASSVSLVGYRANY